MRHDPADDHPIFRDSQSDADGEPDPDIVPDDARGGITVPSPNQTGITTPPISGWGETVEGEERTPESDPEE